MRQQVAQSYAMFDAGIVRLLEPFQGRNPSALSRKTLLRKLTAEWKSLNPFGRLRLKIGTDRGVTAIDEVRCCPSAMYAANWTASENTLAIVLYSICIEPRAVVKEKVYVLAMVCQHALARRFERGDGRSNLGVLTDLLPLITAWPSTIKQPGDFSIKAGNGAWRGEVTTLNLDTERMSIMSVRTFITP